MSADALQRMIVSGGRWPEAAAMSSQAERQLRLRLKNACLLARSFVEHGIGAVVDDIVIGKRVDHLLAELADQPFHFIMLTPTLEAVRQREHERGTRLWERWAWMDDEIRSRTRRIGLWIYTSDQSPDETVDEILRRVRTEGLVAGR